MFQFQNCRFRNLGYLYSIRAAVDKKENCQHPSIHRSSNIKRDRVVGASGGACAARDQVPNTPTRTTC